MSYNTTNTPKYYKMMQNDAKYHTIQLNTTKITNICAKIPQNTRKHSKSSTNTTNTTKCHKIHINTTKYPTLP